MESEQKVCEFETVDTDSTYRSLLKSSTVPWIANDRYLSGDLNLPETE